MLIKEEYITSSLLDTIPYLDNQPLSEATIPVTENSRLGKYIVALEDINKYCNDCSSDPGYVISQICEMNNISVNDIAFSVTPENIILGEDVAENAIHLMNEGADVLAKPVVHDNLYNLLKEDCERIRRGEDSILLQEVTKGFLDKMLGVKYNYGSGSRINPNQRATEQDLNARVGMSKYSYEPSEYEKEQLKKLKMTKRQQYEHIGQSVRIARGLSPHAPVVRAAKRRADEDRAWNIHDYGDEFANANINNPEKAAENFEKLKNIHTTHYFIDDKMRKKKEQDEADKEAMKNTKEEVKSGMDEIHKMEEEAYKSNNKNFIARIIARLHDLSNSYSEKYKNIKVSGPKTAIQKVLSYITRAISSLTKRLHNISTKYKIN